MSIEMRLVEETAVCYKVYYAALESSEENFHMLLWSDARIYLLLSERGKL
jgi:hypothetical protein